MITQNYRIVSAIPVLLIIPVVMAVYLPGVNGGFLFDDYPNLKLLHHFDATGINIQSIMSYIDASYSGPTKRPVSMLSFLIDYPSWPDDPSFFKRTNLLIHAINALLVAWVAYLILKISNNTEQFSRFAAVLAGLLFALHPLQVSTVLYVVQRMAMLATMFSLVAIIAYCKGRKLLTCSQHSGWGWVLVCLIVPMCIILSMLSKENGVLTLWICLAVEILILKAALPLNKKPKFVILGGISAGSILLGIYLVRGFYRAATSDHSYLHRDFTLVERLLTESRIVVEYIFAILVPRMQSYGVYSDGYTISHSLTDPITTSFSILFHLVLLGISIRYFRRLPIISLAILAFYIGHTIESTFISLELYYEHRNYLPAIFIFIASAEQLLKLYNKKPLWGSAIIICILLSFSLLTFNRASLWGSKFLLTHVWAENNKNSPRAQLQVASDWLNLGNFEKSAEYSVKAIQADDKNPRAWIHALVLNCASKQNIIAVDMENLKLLLIKRVYHQTTYNYLHALFIKKRSKGCTSISYEEILELYDILLSKQEVSSPNIKALFHYEQGSIYLAMGLPEEALDKFSQALNIRSDLAVGLVEVGLLASAGHYTFANKHAERVRDVLEDEKRKNDLSATRKHKVIWLLKELDILVGKIPNE